MSTADPKTRLLFAKPYVWPRNCSYYGSEVLSNSAAGVVTKTKTCVGKNFRNHNTADISHYYKQKEKKWLFANKHNKFPVLHVYAKTRICLKTKQITINIRVSCDIACHHEVSSHSV